MKRFSFVLVCTLAILAVDGRKHKQLLKKEGNLVKDLTQLVQKTKFVFQDYEDYVEIEIPFKQFNASLEALDIMAQDYNGPFRRDIYDANNLGNQASDTYFRATDKVFGWSSAAGRLLNFSLKPGLENRHIVTAVLRVIEQGIPSIHSSIEALDKVRAQIGQMRHKLEPFANQLKSDLAELKPSDNTRRVPGKTERYVTKILEIVTGAAGNALRIYAGLYEFNVPFMVSSGKVQPSQREKIAITQAYYETLIQFAANTDENIDEIKRHVQGELEKLLTKFQEIAAAKDSVVAKLEESAAKSGANEEEESSDEVSNGSKYDRNGAKSRRGKDDKNQLLEALEALRVAVNDYLARHGSPFV